MNTLANTAAARACTAGMAAEQAFDYVPLTFVLPDDLELFRRAYDDNDHQGRRNIWIIKPVRRASLPLILLSLLSLLYSLSFSCKLERFKITR